MVGSLQLDVKVAGLFQGSFSPDANFPAKHVVSCVLYMQNSIHYNCYYYIYKKNSKNKNNAHMGDFMYVVTGKWVYIIHGPTCQSVCDL